MCLGVANCCVLHCRLSTLLAAGDARMNRDYKQSCSLLTQQSQKPEVMGSTLIMTSLGHSLYLDGKSQEATEVLLRVCLVDY